MEVRFKATVALFSVMLFAACAPEKSKTSVFPEANNNLTKTSQCASSSIKNRFVVRWEDGHFSTETAANADVFKNTFLEKNLAKVAFVEFDKVISAPEVTAQSLTQSSVDWGPTMIQADQAWSQGYKGQGIIIGVVDSGVDIAHPQLVTRLAVNEGEIPSNGIDDDGNGYVDDAAGYDFYNKTGHVTAMTEHGTHVSGIALADPTQGETSGVAPEANLVPTNFMSAEGGGSLGDAIEAMNYVASRGAKVINASWGGAPCIESLKFAIQNLEAKGVLFIVASGNSGLDLDTNPEYPAAYNLANQITVAASTISDRMAGFSNTSFNLVHIVAPGANIYSTLPGGQYGSLSGTSMATPMVSGAAAVVWSARPQATPAQVKAALLKSVDKGLYRVSSQGRLNVAKAVLEIQKMIP